MQILRFSNAKEDGDNIGLTKVRKGIKIMIMVDTKWFLVAACSEIASFSESKLVRKLVDFVIIDKFPKRVIRDKLTIVIIGL